MGEMGDMVKVVAKLKVFAPASDVLTLTGGLTVVVIVVVAVSVKIGNCSGIEVGG